MSEARVDLLSNRLGTGPATLHKQWASKAWINFNGTGTAAIRDSENTSSLTDGGTGTFTQNFSNAMASSDYCVATAQGTFANGDTVPIAQTTTTSQLNTYNTNTLTDAGIAMAVTHGDLA